MCPQPRHVGLVTPGNASPLSVYSTGKDQEARQHLLGLDLRGPGLLTPLVGINESRVHE